MSGWNLSLTKKLLHACIWMVVLLSASHAIPVPKGIDGTILELDGVTPVPNGIYFEITNLNTNEVVSAKTGLWGQGVYVVSIGGNDFDQILVRAWSDYNTANATFVLQGVLHNANLLLNMSIPTLPPNITSTPSLIAYKNQVYSYQIEATDRNNDNLTFSLMEYPVGMNISPSGLVQWIPKQQDIGHHIVRLAVFDGIFSVDQQYLLFVESVNAPPAFISEPVSIAVVRQRYLYDANATDPDDDNLTYGLLQKPDRMTINVSTGLIQWIPLRNQRGIANVSLFAFDGNLTSIQSYSIQVLLLREKLAGEKEEEEETEFEEGEFAQGDTPNEISGGSDEKVPIVNLNQSQKNEGLISANASETLSFADVGVDLQEFAQRPQQTMSLERPVYKYFLVQGPQNSDSDREISFRVENDWLTANGILRKNMRISRFTNRWEELPFQLLTGDERYSYYSAQAPGFGYFAIHGKDERTKAAAQPSASRIEAPYQLSGSIYFFGKRKQIPKGSVLSLTNQKTNQTVLLRTGTGPLDGAFSLFMKGNHSDPITVAIPQYEQAFETTLEDNNALHLTLSLPNSGLQGISGFSIADGVEPSLIGAIMALLFVFLMIHAQTLIYKKKKKK